MKRYNFTAITTRVELTRSELKAVIRTFVKAGIPLTFDDLIAPDTATHMERGNVALTFILTEHEEQPTNNDIIESINAQRADNGL